MAAFDLAGMTRRARNPRRRVIALRPITPPALQATALYTSVYAPAIAIWSASLESIAAAYAQSLSELQTDAPADVTARIEAASSSVSGLIVSLRFAIWRWSESVEAWHRRRWVGNVLTATNVSLDTLIGASDVRATLATVIERNVALVSSVSDETRRKIADAAFRGLTERKPAAEFAKEIRGFVDMSRARAKRIAGDQLAKLGGELNDERRRQAGIDSWEWIHSGKRHPREDHKARNGLFYSDNPDRWGKRFEGKLVRKPPEDRPSQLPFCGCTSRAVLLLGDPSEDAVVTPAPARRGFTSPLNPEVNAATIVVESRLALQKVLRDQFADAAKDARYEPTREFAALCSKCTKAWIDVIVCGA